MHYQGDTFGMLCFILCFSSQYSDADIEVRLRVSNFFKDVAICMLSDDNFTKEEVEDAWDRIKAGSLNRLTVWIAKEISMLQKLAEHANEKGWQREKFEYLERRKMLQKPFEKEKLILKFPEVVAEEIEVEATVTAASGKAEISDCSPKSILRGSSDVSSVDASGSGEIGTPPKVNLNDSHTNGIIDWVVDVPLKDTKGYGGIGSPPKVILSDPCTPEAQNGGIHWVADIPLKLISSNKGCRSPMQAVVKAVERRMPESQNNHWLQLAPMRSLTETVTKRMTLGVGESQNNNHHHLQLR